MRRAFAALVVASSLCCAFPGLAVGGTMPGAPAEAASAVEPAPSATGAEPDEATRAAVQALEERFERLREAQEAAHRDIEAARTRLRELQAPAHDALLYGLAALVLLLLGVIVLLLWRLARLRGEQAWLREAQSLTVLEPRPSEIERMARGPPGFDEVTATSMRVVDEAADDRRAPPVPMARAAAAPSPPTVASATRLRRELTAEELFDLEQQADFFMAIGQEESAIDLLMAQVRSSGGASPMPYLKLLRIYRRRDESDAYERVRERFNRRFNGQAPAWGAEPDDGRSLAG